MEAVGLVGAAGDHPSQEDEAVRRRGGGPPRPRAAKRLGIGRNTLYRKLEKHGIERPERREAGRKLRRRHQAAPLLATASTSSMGQPSPALPC